MRKLIALLTPILLLAVVFAVACADTTAPQNDASIPGPSFDFAHSGNPNSAFITKDFGCNVIDGDGVFVFTADGNVSVVTSSGHTTLICKVKGVANSTGRAVIFRDFGCNTLLGFTTNSQNTVSASGNVTLRCRI